VTSLVIWFAWAKILNGSATGSAVTMGWMPFFVILGALSGGLIRNFVSYAL